MQRGESLVFAAQQAAIDQAADDGHDPEEPELLERPDGCYKQVDNCPTGTVKGEGDVCVPTQQECPEGKVKDGEDCLDECELAEKRGEETPEGCPDCSKDFPLDPWGKPAAGAVACNGTKTKICVSDKRGSFWTKEAEDSALTCLKNHETEHKNDPNITCATDGWANIVDLVVRYNAEMIAYQNQAKCFREGMEKCGSNPVCYYEHWSMIQVSEIMKINYRNWRDAAQNKK